MPIDTDASFARRTVRARAARLSALLLGGLFVGFLLLVVVFIEYRRAIDWVDHTHEVISTVEEVWSSLSHAESGQRGYLLSQDRRHLASYEEGAERSRTLLDRLGSLTADNQDQQDKVKALRGLAADRLNQLAEVLRQADEAGLERALVLVREGASGTTMGEVRRLIATMRAEEDVLLAGRSRNASFLELLMIGYGLTFLTVAAWLGVSTVRRLERDYQAERAEGQALAASLQDNRILLDEVNHRVKNSLQIVANLLRTQALKHRSQEVRQELLDSSTRVLAIAEVHRRLYGEGAVYDTVELSDLIRSIAENAVPSAGTGEQSMDMAVQASLSAPVETAVPVALIVNELLTNSYKHAFPDGRRGTVKVDMAVQGNEVRIDVADDGVGLPEEVASSAGGGFGLNTVRNLTRQIRGRLEIERLTPGTRFLLTFPIKPRTPTQA
ncbi:CHASE3 domain-containing protein [Azospirillum sp. YIM B02556]|uniref:histidine kinase n=1 Tax=Azospirillum endophyticum TaxID=2800326 RepID=A0ABS1FHA7_9PROT|nr:CHASE3 domain-containing protein [Azospirillum endophyticum]MBK1842799.1 CHASE3 domain-containing protein [Azospirillum endophyticum]